MKIIPETGHAH